MVTSFAHPRLRAALMFMVLAVSGCAYGYQEANWFGFGGYKDVELAPDLWSLSYEANVTTTTITTMSAYWLYRASELTLSKGYEGFSIESGFPLTERYGAWKPYQIASVVYIPIFIPGPRPNEWSKVSGTIKLLHPPFQIVPGQTFDAAATKDHLTPYVSGPKCDGNNVCPEVRQYFH